MLQTVLTKFASWGRRGNPGRIGSGILIAVACVAAIAGCGRTAAGIGSAVTSATVRTATPHTTTLPAPWPERDLLPENGTLAYASQVYDPATGTLYALAAMTPQAPDGPYVLEAVNVRTGAIRRGGTYQASELSLAAGYLWVPEAEYAGSGEQLMVQEVGLGSLTTVRSAQISSDFESSGVAAAVAAGPAGSVWAGAGNSLLRVSVSNGAVLARATLPAGLGLSGMAADPDGGYLYVSAAHELGGGASEGAVILEYAADTGELLATADRSPIDYSISGADLTGVPGGVVGVVPHRDAGDERADQRQEPLGSRRPGPGLARYQRLPLGDAQLLGVRRPDVVGGDPGRPGGLCQPGHREGARGGDHRVPGGAAERAARRGPGRAEPVRAGHQRHRRRAGEHQPAARLLGLIASGTLSAAPGSPPPKRAG
jgi:hypothetical protein